MQTDSASSSLVGRRHTDFLEGTGGADLIHVLAATASAGGFEKPLTDSEREFVISKFPEADTAFDTVNLIQAQHGVAARLIEETAARHENEIMLVNKFIADIENINVAEAVSRLNNDQTALEASFKVFSQLNSLSLLRFL